MTASTYRLRTAQDETPLRRRASGLALALGINLLLLLALLGIGALPDKVRKPASTLVVSLLPESAPAPQPETTASEADRRVPPPKIILPVKPSLAPTHKLDMIEMTREEFAAADISRLPKSPPGAGTGGAGDSEEVGRGPNGEILYAAEWARHPTHAELAGYLPANAPEGSGLVACRTIPGDRVEDCIELGNDPPGSHLARAVRLAAWQFRVRPPRINGKPLIGEWVRIRIDYHLDRRER